MRDDWKITLHGVNAAAESTPTDFVSTSVVTGLASHASAVMYIQAPKAQWQLEGENFTGGGGALLGFKRRRRKFDVECFPVSFASSTFDLTDIDAFASVLANRKYHYIEVEAGTERRWPTTAGTAHPVVAESWTENVNKSAGLRTLVVNFLHKYIVS